MDSNYSSTSKVEVKRERGGGGFENGFLLPFPLRFTY